MERPVEDPGFTGIEGGVALGEGEGVFGIKGTGAEGGVFVSEELDSVVFGGRGAAAE